MRRAGSATRWLLGCGVALALVAAACGSDDDPETAERGDGGEAEGEASEHAAAASHDHHAGEESPATHDHPSDEESPAAGDEASAHGSETEGLIPHGDWTDEQVAYMLDRIEATERVLPERYPVLATHAELQAALGPMGFFNFGATAPGGYDHWINPGWMVDEHFIEPELSESLVYQVQNDGRWKLVSAMYMLAPTDTMEDIPENLAFLPGWHVHPELCTGPDGTFGGITDPENPSCPPGTTQANTSPMMHIWLEDPGCGHRFGGIGVGGLHCAHGAHHAEEA